jgi:uncharacterized protein YraI
MPIQTGFSMTWCKHVRTLGRQLRLLGVVAGGAAAFAMLVTPPTPALASPATAEPATSAAYPAGAAAAPYSGPAFDTCTTPSLAAMTSWSRSPYRAIGVYIGGVNLACSQPQLTANWVTEVSTRRWRLLPVYVGLQAPCVIWNGRSRALPARAIKRAAQKIAASGAASQGTAAADDAAANAKALGMRSGSAIYDDIENYSTTDTTCRVTVLRFVSGWTNELHRLGYLAGVYVNLGSGAPDLSSVYTSASYSRPDALWVARWDGNSSLTGWAGIPDGRWGVHQRAKQYRGPHNETRGAVTIDIDSDNLDAPVATVAYGYPVTAGINARTGPSTSYPIARTYPPGSTVPAICQAPGSTVATTSVWDKLADGTYVSDYYVSTPSNTGYSAPLPPCEYPYQVTTSAGLFERTGPGTRHPAAGQLPDGALAWVVCQEPGSPVGTTSVWDKLQDGHWVSDEFVATPSKTTYSAPAPRC